MISQKQSAREYFKNYNVELNYAQVRKQSDEQLNNNYRFNENHYHTRNVVWGKIPQHVPGQYISHSFAMRVEESREEDEAAGYI